MTTSKKMRRETMAALVVVMLSACILGVARAETSMPRIRLLFVDETKTFLSTMRIGGLVGALKGSGLFEVDVRFADVESSWDDPLAGEVPEEGTEPYDIVLVVPRGIDDGTADWVWMISDGPFVLPPYVAGGLGMIGQVVGLVFEGTVRPVGLYDDYMLNFLYALYVSAGWMR